MNSILILLFAWLLIQAPEGKLRVLSLVPDPRHRKHEASTRHMEKLFQISCPVILSLLLAPALGIAQSSDYCSLVVKLIDSAGAEDSSRQVITVTETTGRTISMDNHAGGASFCDLGILPVTIRVTRSYCFDIALNNVSLTFGKTTTVKVLSDSVVCSNVDSPPTPWCTFLLRFKDEEDKWISGIALRPVPPATDFRNIDPMRRADPYAQTDHAGRVLVFVGREAAFLAIATINGYMPQAIELQCSTYFGERVVSMNKAN